MTEVKVCGEMVDRWKIFSIVEYVRSNGREFPYDSDDVIENMQHILADYGIYNVFTDEEYYELLEELLLISESQEISEAVRFAESQVITGQDLRLGTDFRIPANI